MSSFDPSHLLALLAGAVGATAGFMGRRLVTGAVHQERIARYASLAEIAAKMKTHGFSVEDVASLDAFFRTKHRESQLTAGRTISGITAPEFSIHPDSYWTQTEMNKRAGGAFAAAEAQLNEALTQLEDRANPQFEAAQEAWERFRELQVAYAGSRYAGGTIVPLIRASEAEALTRQRLAWAEAQLEELKRHRG